MSLLSRSFRLQIAETVRETRRAHGWSQAELGRRAGVSQSTICRIERGSVEKLTFETASRVLDALGIRVSIDLRSPLIADRRRQSDAGHARCVAYVDRRLERQGWIPRTEVQVISGNARGWIDILAYRPSDQVLLLVEVKTDLPDIGAVMRQQSWYEREASQCARQFGWRPRRLVSGLFVLASATNIARIQDNRELLRRNFDVPVERVARILAGAQFDLPNGARACGLIDPYERSGRWLLRSPLHGRPAAARYRNYAGLMDRVRGGRVA
jgi:transcriptional regulator with XRE-family HTH domain